VRAHVLLEIEVSKLVGLLELEKAGKLGVGVDLATIRLVLEVVVTDVDVNLTSNLGARHLSAGGLLKEGSKLVTDSGGLNKAAGCAVASLALALGTLLLGSLELTAPLLLESAVIGLKGRHKSVNLLKLSEELDGLLGNGGGVYINKLRSVAINGGAYNGSGGRDSLLLGSAGLLGLGRHLGRGGNNGLNNGSRVGGLGSFAGSNHYTLLKRLLFK